MVHTMASCPGALIEAAGTDSPATVPHQAEEMEGPDVIFMATKFPVPLFEQLTPVPLPSMRVARKLPAAVEYATAAPLSSPFATVCEVSSAPMPPRLLRSTRYALPSFPK